jgi:sugar phosphate isomerase/epimerase
MKTGILLDSLQLGLYEGLSFAVAAGADGVQFYASRGELTPWNSSPRDMHLFRQRCADLGLELAALCGEFGGHGFERANEHEERIRKTRELIDFGLELGTRIVSMHIGVVPEDRNSEIYQNLRYALSTISEYAGKRGAVLAVETGPEPAERLAAFIVDCGTTGLGVNFDPANLVMVQGSNAATDFARLAPLVAHVHGKDGIRKKVCDARLIYDSFAEDDFATIDINEYFDELPLGSGAVNFPQLLAAMSDCGYTGFLTIEREAGNQRQTDVAAGIRFLKDQLRNLGIK